MNAAKRSPEHYVVLAREMAERASRAPALAEAAQVGVGTVTDLERGASLPGSARTL